MKMRTMFKKMMSITAVAGFVLALAPAAQAAVITFPQDGYSGAYRIAFVTNGTTTPDLTDIAAYNTYVTDQAGLVPDLNNLTNFGVQWNVIGSTVGVSAKENTSTQLFGDAGYDIDNDVPIYTTNGLRIADDNADLWDGSIQQAIWYGDGTEIIEVGQPGYEQKQAWTGTNADGSTSVADAPNGSGSYLGSGPNGDNTSPYIRLVRGGYTDGNWISGPSDHDAIAKHFLALSSPLSPGIAALPEPGTVALFLTGLGILSATRRHKSIEEIENRR